MDTLKQIELALAPWYKEFYDPAITDGEPTRDANNLMNMGYSAEEVDAGVTQYRNTYQYGRTRNWAHLLMSIGKVRNANMNIMPAGIAADHYVAHFGYEDFQRLAVREGYDPISANIADSVVSALGIGIGQEEPKFVRMKFISLYKELVNSYMSVEGQSAKQLGDGIEKQKRLPVDINKVAAEMRKLEKAKGR